MSRKALVQDLLRGEHFGGRQEIREPAQAHEIELSSSWGQRWDVAETPLLGHARENFLRFCTEKFGLAFTGEKGMRWSLRPGGSPSAEAFVITVAAEAVEIEAGGERGLLHASHYLERLMADRGGPFLPLGRIERNPALSPRFTESTFVPAIQTPEHPGEFPEEYLALMSHFGSNALKFYVNLYELWPSDTLPELKTASFETHIENLRNLARRTREFGLDLYLHLNTPPLPADHPVFAAHPDVRGAQVEIFLEELSGKAWHALCSSQEKVRRAYRETLERIFREIPELGGAVAIIGGECFFHCFTRPFGSELTNCPHCRGKDAHEQVAGLVNALNAGMQEGQRLFAWPYSAFIWSREDPTQSRWIRFLDPGVGVLANFDCFDPDVSTGGKVRLFDYNIKLIGPSSVFAAQEKACRERGLEIFVKTETNTTVDSFFLPYLPVYFRWFERFRAIRKSGARGFMGQWRFYSMNGSIPEELQYHSVWNPEASAEDLLSTIAKRDFALKAAEAEEAVQAWKQLSGAWDDFPWSAMTSGEREAYMRGPWYLGPAHPLIFNPQNFYGLGPKFFILRGDIAEMASAEEIARFSKKPRYVSDLLLCLPFGVKRYLELTGACRQRWEAGVQRLRAALASSEIPKARRELGICEIVGIHLQSLENVVRFYAARDRLGHEPADQPAFETIMDELRKIAGEEAANARRSLPLLENDPRIGFGYTYGEVYDADMVREKIAQCEYLMANELNRIESLLRFHIWQEYP